MTEDLYRKTGVSVNREGISSFTVWAPFAGNVSVLPVNAGSPLPMKKDHYGYWNVESEHLIAGTRYYYLLDNSRRLPDPASLFQPEGVHGPSEIFDVSTFQWTDTSWKGISLEKMIFYELHTGTFSEEGNFKGIIKRLPYLADLGITAIEIMPVSQFPGTRNWGYDGVYPFAVQNSYGGPSGLMHLVDECHKAGLAVFLDVVYNHLGPEGNYLAEFGPYFTKKYHTPWGQAINFDDEYSYGVRNFVVSNALMWLEDFHLDGLRLDAVHSIFDFSARHIMQEIAENVKNLHGRERYIIAESALNDSRYINPPEKGGYGLSGQWNDDFHHALHVVSTGEKSGYYADFEDPGLFSRSFTSGFAYDGQYSVFRKRSHGNSGASNPGHQFVVFSQNHDQVGNRKLGERLASIVSFEMLKVIAGAVLISPYLPLLFMGEEYGELNPFLYFVDHSDAELNKLVYQGRQDEFKSFHTGNQEPAPDPSDINTFRRSKLTVNPFSAEDSKALLAYYKFLISLRKTHPVLSRINKENLKAGNDGKLYTIERWEKENRIIAWLNFSEEPIIQLLPASFRGNATLLINSSDKQWAGPGREMAMETDQNGHVSIGAGSMVVYSTL